MSRFARFRLSFRSGQESPARRDPIELKRPHRVPGARSSVAGADIANVSADSSGHPLPSRGARCLERDRLLLPVESRVKRWAILEFLVHGVRSAFPPILGPVASGIPPAGAALSPFSQREESVAAPSTYTGVIDVSALQQPDAADCEPAKARHGVLVVY